MRSNKTIKYILAIILVEAIGALGTLFTTPAIKGWYTTLVRPVIAPPNWVFGPVWTLLFALIGISLAIIWQKPQSKYRTLALKMFAVQLVLNVGWSAVFFGAHQLGWAVVEIMAMIVAIAFNIFYAQKLSKTAGWLLVPYLLWVSFATLLTISFWRLN